MLLLEYQHSKILLSAELGKWPKRTVFNVLVAAQKKKKTPLSWGKLLTKKKLTRTYAQIVERPSLVSYASSMLNTFENMKHRKK